MDRNMFGVVLWSDPVDRKAVIWCEDQGDLAFYRHADATQDLMLEAGDWVQFDLETQRQQRFVRNPRLIEGGACKSLPDLLVSAQGEMSGSTSQKANADAQTAEIIPFMPAGRQVDRDMIGGKARHA